MKKFFKAALSNAIYTEIDAAGDDMQELQEALAELITAGSPDISILQAEEAARALLLGVISYQPAPADLG